MSTSIEWYDVALRLALTVLAGGLIGFNRSEHGLPAGLRTSILVCLAASVSMIQANLLLTIGGRSSDSFIMMDVMRLPLGILSGMGFIGGGAILRRGNMVLGVTTAATLWFITVMGLCFGGGQLALGLAMLALGLLVLWALKWFEQRIVEDRRATLLVTAGADGPSEEDIRQTLERAGFRTATCAVSYSAPGNRRTLRCDLVWRGRVSDSATPGVIRRIAERPGVLQLQWRP